MARYIVFYHPNDPVPDRMKYIDDASTAPDANDDGATLGVTVGSLWLDTTNHAVYICEDVSTGAAVWTELTGSGGSAAPASADYLVGTANGSLSGEIVVGTSPGGELGGTWASPTVDTTHSGSSHAGIQSAAEATAAAALSAHTGDTSDAHDASAISVADTGGNFTATDVEAALAELVADIAAVDGTDLKSLSVDLTVSGATTIDRDTAATFDLTLTGATTLTPDATTTSATEALDLRLLIRQDGTGSRTLAWGGTITWVGGSAPTMPTAANAMMTVGLLSVDEGVTWLGYYDQNDGSAATLDDLTDVDTDKSKTPADGDVLTFDGTDWNAETPAAGGASALTDLSDVDLTGLADGDILRYDSTSGDFLPEAPAAASVTAAGVKAVGRWEPIQYHGAASDPLVYFDEPSPPYPFVYFDGEIVVGFVTTP